MIWTRQKKHRKQIHYGPAQCNTIQPSQDPWSWNDVDFGFPNRPCIKTTCLKSTKKLNTRWRPATLNGEPRTFSTEPSQRPQRPVGDAPCRVTAVEKTQLSRRHLQKALAVCGQIRRRKQIHVEHGYNRVVKTDVRYCPEWLNEFSAPCNTVYSAHTERSKWMSAKFQAPVLCNFLDYPQPFMSSFHVSPARFNKVVV